VRYEWTSCGAERRVLMFWWVTRRKVARVKAKERRPIIPVVRKKGDVAVVEMVMPIIGRGGGLEMGSGFVG
jgi:hypothetical protein